MISRQLDHGANLKAQTEDGILLHLANHCDFARFFLDRGSSLEASDDDGCTPLHRKCSRSNTALVCFPSHQGADLEAMSNRGCRPLHYAALGNYDGEARLLLDRVAVINATTLARTAPPSFTCKRKGQMEMMRRCPWLVVTGQLKCQEHRFEV